MTAPPEQKAALAEVRAAVTVAEAEVMRVFADDPNGVYPIHALLKVTPTKGTVASLAVWRLVDGGALAVDADLRISLPREGS